VRVARGPGIPAYAAMAAAPLAVAYGLLASGVASRHGDVTTYAGRSTAAAVAELVAGWALIAFGSLSFSRRPERPAGPLAVAAGFAWFAPDWLGWQTGPGGVRAVALAVAGVPAAAVVQLAIGAPSGSLSSRWARAVVVVSWVVTALVGIGRALFYDPLADPDCVVWCSPNPLLVHGDRSLVRVLDAVEPALSVLAVLAVVAFATRRLLTASPAARRGVWPVVVPAGVFLCAWAGRLVALAADPAASPGRPIMSTAFWLRASALAALAAGLSWALVRAARGVLAVRRLAREPDRRDLERSLEAALVAATGDPSLRVAFPLRDGELWIDTRGIPIAIARPASGLAVTTVVREGQPVAAVLHDPAILDGPLLAREIGTAAQVAVDNERLRAEARLQLRELRTSRARIVETGDAERRRLERDLHDGAQQRLVGLSMAVRMGRSALSGEHNRGAMDSMHDADEGLQRAISELRDVAHGIHPVELSDEGLAAAVEALADRAPILVGSLPAERLPPAVETTAYVLVDEVTRRAGARGDGTTLSVDARCENGRLIVSVEDPGETSPELAATELLPVRDRIGALEGRLSIEPLASGGTRIEGELPCA
jgi:signal transduction histidine kinase